MRNVRKVGVGGCVKGCCMDVDNELMGHIDSCVDRDSVHQSEE